jgi:hypothetical protein
MHQGAAAEARTRWKAPERGSRSSGDVGPSGRGNRHGASLGRGGGRQRIGSRASGTVETARERQPRLGRGGGHQSAAAEARADGDTSGKGSRSSGAVGPSGRGSRHGANLGRGAAAPAAPGSGSRASGRWRHQGAAAAEARARWRHQSAVERISGAVEATRARQPKLGPVARISGAEEAPGCGAILEPVERISGTRARSSDQGSPPGRESRHGANLGRDGGHQRHGGDHQGTAAEARARCRHQHQRRGGGHQGTAAEPRARWSTSAARWRPPGHGSRSSGAVAATSGANLGPVERISGAVETTRAWQSKLRRGAGTRAAAEPRARWSAPAPAARWMHQGAAAEARARGAHQRRGGAHPGHGSRASGP